MNADACVAKHECKYMKSGSVIAETCAAMHEREYMQSFSRFLGAWPGPDPTSSRVAATFFTQGTVCAGDGVWLAAFSSTAINCRIFYNDYRSNFVPFSPGLALSRGSSHLVEYAWVEIDTRKEHVVLRTR
jgi:hypothetical protein